MKNKINQNKMEIITNLQTKKFSIKVCAIKLNLAIGSVSILKVKCTQDLKINLQKQQ